MNRNHAEDAKNLGKLAVASLFGCGCLVIIVMAVLALGGLAAIGAAN